MDRWTGAGETSGPWGGHENRAAGDGGACRDSCDEHLPLPPKIVHHGVDFHPFVISFAYGFVLIRILVGNFNRIRINFIPIDSF